MTTQQTIRWECPSCYDKFDHDGICPDCKSVFNEEVELRPHESEFGSGLVICFVKFTEHLSDEWIRKMTYIDRWAKMNSFQQDITLREARDHPNGDSANHYGWIPSYMQIYKSPERAIESLIEIWGQGAGDHFIDLNRSVAGPQMIALAEAVLRIRFAHLRSDGEDVAWSFEDMTNIRKLWKAAALELEEQLGTPDAQWGQW